MVYFFDLIAHYLSSNSRHGTHSPFVYKLADTVLYKKSNDICALDYTTKEEKLIYKLSKYFEEQCELKVTEVDLAAVDPAEVISLKDEYSVVFFRNIYKNSSSKRKWKSIIFDQKMTVSMDLFYFGIVIWRVEQPKEHFKLRFPYRFF